MLTEKQKSRERFWIVENGHGHGKGFVRTPIRGKAIGVSRRATNSGTISEQETALVEYQVDAAVFISKGGRFRGAVHRRLPSRLKSTGQWALGGKFYAHLWEVTLGYTSLKMGDYIQTLEKLGASCGSPQRLHAIDRLFLKGGGSPTGCQSSQENGQVGGTRLN